MHKYHTHTACCFVAKVQTRAKVQTSFSPGRIFLFISCKPISNALFLLLLEIFQQRTLFWQQFYSFSTSQHFEYSEYFETDSPMPTPAPVWQETRSQALHGVTQGHPASSLPTCFPHPSPCNGRTKVGR